MFEYLQLGRAIVAPDTENIREILTHEQDALLFHATREGAMEDALERLSTDAALRERLGQAAQRTIGTRSLTWDHNAERVVTLAEAAINNKQ